MFNTLLRKFKIFLKNPDLLIKKFSYFIAHPITLIINRHEESRLRKLRVPNFDWNINSDLPIDVVFPTVAKDLPVVSRMVDSVRKYVRHPIGQIFIIAPKEESIVNLCKEKNCVF